MSTFRVEVCFTPSYEVKMLKSLFPLKHIGNHWYLSASRSSAASLEEAILQEEYSLNYWLREYDSSKGYRILNARTGEVYRVVHKDS